MDTLGTVYVLELWLSLYILFLKMPKSLCSLGAFLPFASSQSFHNCEKKEKRKINAQTDKGRNRGERRRKRKIEIEQFFLHIPILALCLF